MKKIFLSAAFAAAVFALSGPRSSQAADTTATSVDTAKLRLYSMAQDSAKCDTAKLKLYVKTDSAKCDTTKLRLYAKVDSAKCDTTKVMFYAKTDSTKCDTTKVNMRYFRTKA